MSLLSKIGTRIEKSLPFTITRKPRPKIWDAGYKWLYPYLAPVIGSTDRQKQVQVTWNTYYMAMDNEWISACIDAYIIDTLSANFEVYGDNEEDDNQNVIDYLTDFYNRPDGPDGKDSYTKFMWRGLSSYLSAGDWFAEVVLDDTIRGLPIGMYYIQPHRMVYDFETDQWGLAGTDIRYENDEIIHVHIPDPVNELYGKSPIDKCASSITMDIVAMGYNQEYFNSPIDPKGVIKWDPDMKSDEVAIAIKRMQTSMKENPRGTLQLHGGDYITSVTNRDLEFTSLMEMMRDRIISTYGVPPQNVGVYTPGALGNERDNTADKKFKKRLQGKVFRIVEDEFNNTIGKSFNIFSWEEKFHFGDIDLENKLERAQIEDIRVKNQTLTINEVRNGYGLDPLEWGDQPFNPQMAAPPPSQEAEENQEKLDEIRRRLLFTGELEEIEDLI